MKDAALAGLGVALLPEFIAADAIRAGTLVALEVGRQVQPEVIYLAHPEGRKASAKLRALAAWLKESFGDPPCWEDGRQDALAPPGPDSSQGGSIFAG